LAVAALREDPFRATPLALRNETGVRRPLLTPPSSWKDCCERPLSADPAVFFSHSSSKSLSQATRYLELLSLLALPVVWQLETWQLVRLRIAVVAAAAAAAIAVAAVCGGGAGCGGNVVAGVVVVVTVVAILRVELAAAVVATAVDSAGGGCAGAVASFAAVAVADSFGESWGALPPHLAHFDLASRHPGFP